MSEIITVRDGDIIAAEINVIKENAKRVLISSAIEIGRRLVEAKSVVDHGQWMKWLEEKVEYSQSTANNMMKLYQEYGTGEVNLFDNWTNSEAFRKLSYTQHLALLALPFEDRAEFAESHQVADLSTRELEKAVREELEAVKEKLSISEEERMAQAAAIDAAQEKAERAEEEAKINAKQAAAAQKDKDRAEKSEKVALDRLRKLETELAMAKTAEKVAREELDKALDNPTVPESAMEEMRRQLEAEAAQKAAAEVEKKLEDARKVAQEAKLARAAAEEKLADLQKQTKINDPDIIAFQTLAQSMQQSYNDLNKHRLAVAERDADAGKRLAAFQRALLSQWIDVIEGV